MGSEGRTNRKIFYEFAALYQILWMVATTRYSIGTNIYERDWDTLIVLDACRVDALREVASEYSFLSADEIESYWSVGSTSKEWILKTFTDSYIDEIRATTYICGNSFSVWFSERPVDYTKYAATKGASIPRNRTLNYVFEQTLVREEDFNYVEELSQFGDVNEKGETPSAEVVTKFAIDAGREYNSDRLIVHYMQPHSPYLKGAVEGGEMASYESNPMEALRAGVDFDTVWNAYLDNLRYVLDNVSILLENLDSEKVAITADHGELFGEIGFYGHECGIPHPVLKKVPWATMVAEDTESLEPELPSIDETKVQSLEERLGALGYR